MPHKAEKRKIIFRTFESPWELPKQEIGEWCFWTMFWRFQSSLIVSTKTDTVTTPIINKKIISQNLLNWILFQFWQRRSRELEFTRKRKKLDAYFKVKTGSKTFWMPSRIAKILLSLRKEQVLHVQNLKFLNGDILRKRKIAHWVNITIIGMFDIVT